VDPHNHDSHHLTDSWRAGCGESRTSGSEERHGKTTQRNLETASHADSCERSGWELEQPEPGTLVFTSPEKRKYVTVPEPYVEPAPF
jgi:hypothetical protein